MTDSPAMNRLEGSVVLIAGAASGIGASIAQRCTAESARIVCADHDAGAATALADRLGASAIGCRRDVTDAASAKSGVDIARECFGRLDGRVHNAAAPSTSATFVDLDETAWQAAAFMRREDIARFWLANHTSTEQRG